MSSSPASSRVMELFLHPGDEYVGSLEPASLQVLTYVKLYLPDTNNALEIKTSCIPRQFPKERPPFLTAGGSVVASGAETVITYLQEQFSLVEETGGDDLVAYSALLTDRLLPAMLYSKWLNSQNYVDFTRSSYAGLLRFPLTLFYLSWQHRAVHNLIMRGTPQDITLEQRGLELISKAEECVDVIAARLGTQDYFSGDVVSSLDVVMFGYLESIVQSPHCGTDPLSKKLHSHDNLVSFCQRMRKRIFPGTHLRSSNGSSSQLIAESTPKSLWRDPALWMSVGVVSAVLCVQGVRVGLFQHLGHWAADKRQSLRNSS